MTVDINEITRWRMVRVRVILILTLIACLNDLSFSALVLLLFLCFIRIKALYKTPSSRRVGERRGRRRRK